MKQKKQNALSVLLEYAGSHRRLTFLGLGLSAVSMVCSMIRTSASGWQHGI